jgi:hypothetical protein
VTVAALKVAEIAKIYLQRLQRLKFDILRVDISQPFFESCCHFMLL